VLESLPAQHKENGKEAVKRVLWAAAGVAGYAATAAFAPAGLATLGFIVAGTVAVYNGFRLLGAASRGLSLLKLKSDVKDEKFVPKLKAKAGKALSRSTTLNNWANKAFYVTLGAIVASFVPPLAPLAVLVYPVAVLGMLGTWAAADWTRGTAQATMPTAKLVYQHQVAEGVVQPAEKILPPQAAVSGPAPEKKSQFRSIIDLFKKKASKETEKKLEAPVQALKIKPPAP